MRRMAYPLPITKLTIYSLAIPMRRRFSHAAAERVCAEPIVLRLELADGSVGYGEAQPRAYVSGETPTDVIDSIRRIFVPRLVGLHPTSFGEAIEAAADLPTVELSHKANPHSEPGRPGPIEPAHPGPIEPARPGSTQPNEHTARPITAARAAVEIALLDAYGRAFGRSFEAIAGYLEEPWLGGPGSLGQTRYSVVVSSMDPGRAASFVRKVRFGFIRDFKLKVGDDADDARVRSVARAIGAGLRTGKSTLRIDANSAWNYEQALAKLSAWRGLGISCCEQPLARGATGEWARLAKNSPIPLMADESLVTLEDGDELIRHSAAGWFNIRIAKNGGLIPAIRLAILARRNNLSYQLGCMVGETSILSAAGRWFLQLVPNVQFAEGSYGRFLLNDDVVKKPMRFGLGGKWKQLDGPGLGIDVAPARLERLAVTRGIEIPF